MTIQRVTQAMLSERSLQGLQLGLSRLAEIQEQLSTGRVLNRPSDSPTDTTGAMRIRSALVDTRQYVRNAEDGRAWLDRADSTLGSMTDRLRRARELALQGANGGAMSATSREAIAGEIDQLRASLLGLANTTHLGRPLFGGITAGDRAYDDSGAYVGTPGAVQRTVADGITVRVDVEAVSAFGPPGASIFDDLSAMSDALRTGDSDAVRDGLASLDAALDRLVSARADVGARTNRVERAMQLAADAELDLTSSLSELENVDLPRALVDLQLQETAYQAALAATARVMQPSLVDFLR